MISNSYEVTCISIVQANLTLTQNGYILYNSVALQKNFPRISQLISQPTCIGDQPCTWHHPQRPSSSLQSSGGGAGGDDFWDNSVRIGTDFQAGAELLVVDVLVACTWRRLLIIWGGIGRAGGPGWGRGKSRAPGRVQVWELHMEGVRLDHRWAQGHASVLYSSVIWVPQKHFPLNQNFSSSLFLSPK